MTIRVCLVDDQTLVRHGVRGLLGLVGDVEVVAEASDGAEAVEAIGAHRPDVVLLDLRMPRHDGLWTLDELRGRGVEVPVLVLTTFDDDELVLRALRAAPAAICSRTSRWSSSSVRSARSPPAGR